MIGTEIDLLKNYPRTKRNTNSRAHKKTEKSRNIAQCFGKEFFDGERDYGYGGYYYNPKYWEQVVSDIVNYYELKSSNSVLDIGCAKGFMMHDFKLLMPELQIKGVDISEYAIENAMESMKPYVQVANANALPFDDNQFDLVLGFSVIHNLPPDECKQALREIQRVTKKDAFVVVDAWRTEEERIRLKNWVITGKTNMHVDDWISFFEEGNYTGDYYWFII